MTPLERALDLSYPAFAILHQHGRFSGPQHHRVCEAILGDLRIARRQGVRGVVLEIFSRGQQVMAAPERRAAAETLVDQLQALRARCQRQTNSFVTPMGDEMYYRYQQALIDEAATTLAALLQRVRHPHP